MPINVNIVSNQNEMDQVLAIRRKVFIEEQQVPETIEIDKYESLATHIIASLDNLPVGTARWRSTEEGIKLERFAVLSEYRGLGIGTALLNFMLREIDRNKTVYLNSQSSAIEFYLRNNFAVIGEIYFEAGIPHQKMILAK